MKARRVLTAIGLALVVMAVLAACLTAAPTPQVVETQANTPCYFGLGGTRFVAGRGCTINAQSGSIFTADSGAVATIDTLTVTNLISQSIGFSATYITATNAALTNVTGPFTMTEDANLTTVYVDGYLRSRVGPVTAFDPLTALKEFTATKGIIINGHTFTESAPLTITGVLSNVRLLYYQVP